MKRRFEIVRCDDRAEALIRLNELWHRESIAYRKTFIFKNFDKFDVVPFDGRALSNQKIGSFNNCISAVAAADGWRPQREKDYQIICEGCGIEFISHSMQTKYHDDNCRKRHWRHGKKSPNGVSP